MDEVARRSFSFCWMLGLDIVVDKGGEPVLIEANASPDIAGRKRKAGPLVKKDTVLRAFGEYNLLDNRHQRALLRIDKQRSWLH
jgi:hypothetical protein